MLFKKIDINLKKEIDSLGKWYYPINFNGIQVRKDLKPDKTSGLNNWHNYLKFYLPEIKGKRILDIGCNAGLYDLEMSKMGAREVVGVDLNVRPRQTVKQAQFVKDFFSKKEGLDFSNVTFKSMDVCWEKLDTLGKFDFACLFCVVYHFEERMDYVMDELSRITEKVVLQGNLKRFTSVKYKKRPYTKYSGIEDMKRLLKRHGFGKLHIFEFGNYPKPVVIGEK